MGRAFWLYDQTHLAGAQGHFSCQSSRPGECRGRKVLSRPRGLTRYSLSPSTHCFQPRLSFSPFCTHTRVSPSQVISVCNDKLSGKSHEWPWETEQVYICSCNSCKLRQPPASPWDRVLPQWPQGPSGLHSILAKLVSPGRLHSLLRDSTQPILLSGKNSISS